MDVQDEGRDESIINKLQHSFRKRALPILSAVLLSFGLIACLLALW
jgi:hypothetical protein